MNHVPKLVFVRIVFLADNRLASVEQLSGRQGVDHFRISDRVFPVGECGALLKISHSGSDQIRSDQVL